MQGMLRKDLMVTFPEAGNVTVCHSAWPQDQREQAVNGHILVYIGNEQPLLPGQVDQAIIYENARHLKALVINVEHRYFGQSQPFPTDPLGLNLTAAQLQWFKVPQVVEDTAAIVSAVRQELGVPAAVPVIATGCSYGGSLAAYHRLMKPEIFNSAIASSSVLFYTLFTSPWQRHAPAFHTAIAAAAASLGGKDCPAVLRHGFDKMWQLGQSQQGRQQLSDRFKLCSRSSTTALPDAESAWAFYIGYYINTWFRLTKMNTAASSWDIVTAACKVTLAAATAAGADDPLAPLIKLVDFFPVQLHWAVNETLGCRNTAPTSVGPQALPSNGSPRQLLVAFDITPEQFQHQCNVVWNVT
eukprot:gene4943-5184_t